LRFSSRPFNVCSHRFEEPRESIGTHKDLAGEHTRSTRHLRDLYPFVVVVSGCFSSLNLFAG
jgi:hypothetical protein